MADKPTKYIPDPERPDELGVVSEHNHSYYRDRVPPGAAWDTTWEFRYATAAAKDHARNELINAVHMETKRLQEESYTSLGADYLTRNNDQNSFHGQAKSNALAQRSIDGVEGASDENIKL